MRTIIESIESSIVNEAKQTYLVEIDMERRMQPTDYQFCMKELNKLFGKMNIDPYDGSLSNDDYLQFIVTATPDKAKKCERGINGFDCRVTEYDPDTMD